jgi:hypothetical protein
MSVDTIEELRYISDKRPLLSAPGRKLNDVYYSNMNSIVDTVECTYSQGRILQSLPSLSFGGSSQVVIPIGSFIGQTYLHLRLPNLVANQSLERGWGLAAIQSISWIFGSSNVSQVTLNKQSIMQILLAQCETADKANEMFNLAGECLLAPVPSGDQICADILLPFPWSNFSGLFPKKEYDTTLLSNPITVTIQFDQASAIFGGSGTRPSAFLEASVSYRTGDLAQKEMSLRTALMNNPSQMYSYPFIYQQSYVSQSFLGSTDVSSPVTIQIQNFLNADLVGMLISVVKQSDIAPSASSTPNTFNYDEVSNVILNLNGQNVYVSPYKQYKLLNMQSSLGASYFANTVTLAGSTQPFTTNPVNSYVVFVDFSRLRSAAFTNVMQNVWRIGNNSMSVSFNTSTASVAYTMFCTILYNSVLETSNGESRMYLN